MCFLVAGSMATTICNGTTPFRQDRQQVNDRSNVLLVTNGVVIGSLELGSVLRKPVCCLPMTAMARG